MALVKNTVLCIRLVWQGIDGVMNGDDVKQPTCKLSETVHPSI